MQETNIDDIMQKARAFVAENKKWHFHMLTPDCMYNENGKHAFILENETDSESFVTYSDERYMEQGQELVKMLHGKDVVESATGSGGDIQEILEKAKKFNESGVQWHHHILFPNCIFNKHSGKWCIVFEDKEENRLIESLSDNEPKDNLKEIESLFYAQKK